MPSMPRVKGKPKKIAYAILGVPVNMQAKKTKRQSKIDQRLLFEETKLAR